jgi:hypothetical protein
LLQICNKINKALVNWLVHRSLKKKSEKIEFLTKSFSHYIFFFASVLQIKVSFYENKLILK